MAAVMERQQLTVHPTGDIGGEDRRQPPLRCIRHGIRHWAHPPGRECSRPGREAPCPLRAGAEKPKT
jgi:hypothetical protein